jgi:hypothetical protein
MSQNVRNHSENLSNEVCDAIILDLQSQKPKTMKDKLRISKEINNIMAAKIKTLESDLAQSNATLQQMAEENTDKSNVPINQMCFMPWGSKLLELSPTGTYVLTLYLKFPPNRVSQQVGSA